ncbi:MAG: ribosome maturation factor RimM [candidate division Zixibacteria bacterium]|nr:ribosome maturation factor RimM [candidate division Zixibacteria bacterium]
MLTGDVITVGKIGRPRGLNGELYISPNTDFLERFENLTEILINENQGWEIIKVISSKIINGRPVLKFNRVDNPEEAARLTNKLIGVPKEQVFDLPDDTFYLFDLVGCEVYDFVSKKKYGEIIEVEQYPANDIYQVKNLEGKIILVPAVKKYIKEVDINDKKIVIDLTGLEAIL